MVRATREHGKIEYLGRAFHQDAMEAMRGDIVRGIIELITNSDDTYVALNDGRPNKVIGKIVVEVEHRRNQPWKVIVRDRGMGMSAGTMKERLTKVGGRTSGFETGEDRRGNLGRGAKDLAAFGDVTFHSIHDGRYAELVLHTDGTWDLAPERDARDKDRQELGIPKGNGTVVIVEVQPTIRCPQHEKLKQRLSTHYQLRDILADPLRRVDLVNLNAGSKDRLIYTFPTLPVVFEGDLDIVGYPAAKAHLVIWRHPTRYEEGPQDPGRPTGILVKGKRAIYDNTLFRFEGGIHAAWFSGKLTCPEIDRLAREYDDRLGAGQPQDPANPMPIITRRRDGLNPYHPFVRALAEVVEKPLGELVAQEAERARKSAGSGESMETRAALDRLGRELSRLITEELRDIEAEEPEGGEPPLLTIVPPEAFAYMGEDRTLTVAARKQDISAGDEVQISVDPAGVVEVLTPTVKLREHGRREDILVGQIRLRPLLAGEQTLVSASMGYRNAVALIEVKSSREVVEEPITPPETLEFTRPSYRIGWQRRKDLILVAPPEVVAAHGPHATVDSSGSGVVVRTPTVTLELDDAVDFYSAAVNVEGRVLDARSDITARLGDISAVAHVTITRKEEGGLFKVVLAPEDWGSYRGVIEKEQDSHGDEVSIVKIAARHPAIYPYLGENFEGQNSPICRALMAEVVADVTARHIVDKLFRLKRTYEAFDADRLYREHYRRVTKFLPRFQKILVGDAEVARGAESLPPIDIVEVSPI